MKKEMDLSDSARQMEALYYHGVQRRKFGRFTSEEKTHKTIRKGE